MENLEKIQNLQSLYVDISARLTTELRKPFPDSPTLTDCRKQLATLDKDIRRIQQRREFE